MKKKILSIILSAAFGLGAVFAGYSANTMTTLAANGDPADSTHTYKAYQIFKGEVSDGKLVAVEWGDDATAAVQKAITDNVNPVDFRGNAVDKTTATAEDYARGIQAQYAESQTIGFGAEILAAEINKVVTGNGLAITDNKIAGNATGWYLIVDVTELTGDDAVYLDRAQLQFFEKDKTVSIIQKRSTITVEKEVVDINDSIKVTYDDADWGETADHDVDDVIPFRVTGTLPDDFDTYSSFEYVFADKQSAGLLFDATSVKVYKNAIADVNIISSAKYSVTENVNGHSFEVKFDNIKDEALGITKSDKIILYYESKLTGDNVVYGFNGNPNEARIEFSNDKGGKGHTPWDIAIVFTFKPVVNKVNTAGPLEGASFKLEKLVKGEDGKEAEWAAIDKYTQEINGENLSTFTFKGIDDGYYRITETVVPNGYNGIDPIYFVVEAEHDVVGKLTSLTVKDLKGNVLNKDQAATVDLGTFEVSTTAGTLTTDIINQEGVVLPSTGGIGTTIFYVIGGVLVVGAVVLLIVRRRMRNEEE